MAGLLDKRLWIVSGKGGVGKSTVSAALALPFGPAGRRTLVCEVNAQERISGFLERAPPRAPRSNSWRRTCGRSTCAPTRRCASTR